MTRKLQGEPIKFCDILVRYSCVWHSRLVVKLSKFISSGQCVSSCSHLRRTAG